MKTAADGEAAIELAKTEEFDLVFLDIRMPKTNGLETFGELKKITPDIACVFMTGYASAEEDLLNKIKYEGIMCVRKPFENLNKIKEIVENVLKEASLAPDKKRMTLRKKGLSALRYGFRGRLPDKRVRPTLLAMPQAVIFP